MPFLVVGRVRQALKLKIGPAPDQQIEHGNTAEQFPPKERFMIFIALLQAEGYERVGRTSER